MQIDEISHAVLIHTQSMFPFYGIWQNMHIFVGILSTAVQKQSTSIWFYLIWLVCCQISIFTRSRVQNLPKFYSTLLWKLAHTALSEILDSDNPTCSRTFIFSWTIGLETWKSLCYRDKANKETDVVFQIQVLSITRGSRQLCLWLPGNECPHSWSDQYGALGPLLELISGKVKTQSV